MFSATATVFESFLAARWSYATPEILLLLSVLAKDLGNELYVTCEKDKEKKQQLPQEQKEGEEEKEKKGEREGEGEKEENDESEKEKERSDNNLFHRLMRVIIYHCIDENSPEKSSLCFETIANMFKYIHRSISEDLDSMCPYYGFLLGHRRDYIRHYAADTFVRNLSIH